MRKVAFLVLSTAISAPPCAASSADVAVKTPKVAPRPFSWTGFHLGGHLGAIVGNAGFSDPFGPSVFGDNVTTPGFLGGLQFGYDWQVAPAWVVGVGADASLLSSDGAFTCLQASPDIVGSNCAVKPRRLATFTGRFGYVVEPEGRTLIYGKAGAAWMRSDVSVAPNNVYNESQGTFTEDTLIQGEPSIGRVSPWGWTVGAGFEHTLTPAWSVNIGYDYQRFNSQVATPETIKISPTGPTSGTVASVPAGATSHIGQDMHLVKLGLNYRWGRDPLASWPERPAAHEFAGPTKAQLMPAGWQFEGGARYWYSSGSFQSAFPQVGAGLMSQLHYQNLTAHTGEFFARIDSPYNMFLKGFAGAGSIVSGDHFDEDWSLSYGYASAPTAFEVTHSSVGKSSLSYATADIGFDVMHGPDYKLGPFIGYSYYHYYIGTEGCTQLVAPASGICFPSAAANFVGTSESDTWHSFRAGIAGELRFWDRFKIGGDLALIPYGRLEGLDDHRARDHLTLFPTTGETRGLQAEFTLSYFATKDLSIGLGGRYWAMWTTSVTESCNGCGGLGVVSPPGPGRFNTERFGGFLQASYRFN
ncbi:outer membrane beta-barrel protein (plasmid) [Bradyrhizobium sp. CCGUVB1N3]|uniref:outer membrane beta-barrel protein n=1 Tax=Bradyrhizobium sp. CCGUVB1N3 TaxID=2949629 RepID=UPI0020B19142|nr:outer membrane beta-barrel protein [Bradyrhizobium sp. CCGUVB1N3]MCP3477670.1 outer membrane beta-barrel protein [Bradyrhizobium sp. CCGUVB1N3]